MEDKWFYEEYLAYLSHIDNLPKNIVISINTADELSEFMKNNLYVQKQLIRKAI